MFIDIAPKGTVVSTISPKDLTLDGTLFAATEEIRDVCVGDHRDYVRNCVDP